jgi:dolichol kinase
MTKSGPTYNNNLRRILHAIVIGGVALAYGLTDYTSDKVMPALSIVTMVFLFADLMRLQSEPLNQIVQKNFSFILRKHEQHSISGTSWFLIAALLSVSLFPKTAVVMGFLFLAIGDPMASYVGIRWGGKVPGEKTWAGCGAFFITCWLIGSVWLWPYLGIKNVLLYSMICSTFTALAEFWVSEIDDNLVVPIVSATMLTLLLI